MPKGGCFNSDFTCGFVLTPEVQFPLDSVQRLQSLLLLTPLLQAQSEGPVRPEIGFQI